MELTRHLLGQSIQRGDQECCDEDQGAENVCGCERLSSEVLMLSLNKSALEGEDRMGWNE